MTGIRARRALAAVLIAVGLLLAATPAAVGLRQTDWQTWTIPPPFEEND